MYEIENNNDIPGWFLCTLCHEPVENKFFGTTNLFIRHKKYCYAIGKKSIDGKINPTQISEKHISALKEGSVRYKCEDLRPYTAIEGNGLFQLVTAAAELGKSYPMITAEDIKRVLPGRKTVHRSVESKLVHVKAVIASKLQANCNRMH